MAFLPALLTFLSGWCAKFLGDAALRYVAYKAIALLLFSVILPTVLYNLLSALIGEMMTYINSYAASGQSFTMSLAGLAGWLAVKLKIPESFSLIISACVFNLGLRMIPFVRLG